MSCILTLLQRLLPIVLWYTTFQSLINFVSRLLQVDDDDDNLMTMSSGVTESPGGGGLTKFAFGAPITLFIV